MSRLVAALPLFRPAIVLTQAVRVPIAGDCGGVGVATIALAASIDWTTRDTLT